MFTLTENFITPDQERDLVVRIRSRMQLTRKLSVGKERTRILRYGWDYLKPSIWKGAIPEWIPVAMEGCNNVTVNEYPPGHFILPHIDSAAFDDEIMVLSLGENAVMVFTSPMGWDELRELRPRSLATFSGEHRTKFKHSTLPTEQGFRYSVVYRRKV